MEKTFPPYTFVQRLKGYLKNKLSSQQRRKLRTLLENILSVFARNNLKRLGEIYGTDKVESRYLPIYETYFRKLRRKRIKLLEIGVGGYDDPSVGGNSLRMWKKYFHFGKIFSIDICDKSALQESRLQIFKGSQVDEKFLDNVITEIGTPDIIIDDGSHICEHIITTFKLLFPKLKDGGIYVIEDVGTSYWPDFGGDSDDLNNQSTAINYFKSLVDKVNYRNILKKDYLKTYLDKNVYSIMFYNNIIFVHKGDNDWKDESNV
jgi:demethylmacrocin O-methyltransferase